MDHPAATPRRLELVACTVDLAASVARWPDGERSLTPTEAKLLAWLVAQEGRIVSQRELLREVWGYRGGVVSRTVKTTMARLRAKIERDPASPDHLLTAVGVGYRFTPGDPRPEEDTVDGRIPGDEDGADADRRRGNLDQGGPIGALVGRSETQQRIDELLRGGERTLTLVGPTGVGKSALAIRAAAAAVAPGGPLDGLPAWRVDLESRATAAEVARSIADSMGFDLRGDEPVDPAALGPSLAGLGPLLLLLDDVDAAVEVVAGAVRSWQDVAPEVIVLTTCAAPLGLSRERTVAVSPLGLADGAELFTRRAGPAALPQYADRGALPEVLELLDGLPLAIELAAAWATLLAPSELAARLAERLDLLEGPTSGRGGPRSLLAAFEAAWLLLGEGPRDALGQVAVFAGAFSLADAEAVLRPLGSGSGLAALRELVGTSLVLHEPAHSRPFRLLRAIREVAAARGVTEEAQRRHAQWFARLGQPASLEALWGEDAASADAHLRAARDDLAAAFLSSRDAGDGVTATHLLRALLAVTRRHGPATAWLQDARRLAAQTTLPAPLRCQLALDASLILGAVGSVAEATQLLGIASTAATEGGEAGLTLEWHLAAAELAGRTDMTAALASADEAAALLPANAPPRLRARVAATRGAVLSASGRIREGDEALEAAVELARAARDLRTEARALDHLGRNALDRNRPIRARSFHEAALLLSRRLGDPLLEAETTLRLAELHHASGQAADATRALQRGAAIHRELGDRAGEGRCLVLLGELAQTEEQHPQARRALETALEIALQLHDPRLEASARRWLGELYVRLGHHSSGRRHLEQSIARAEAMGDLELHGGALSALCELAFAEGDARTGRELADRVEALLAAASLRAELVGFLERLAELELADGQHGRAEELAARASHEAELSRIDGEATLVRRWT